MQKELVSIIMPTYNSSKFVAESIESIQRQTYSNWELVITDDYSNDETRRIISEFAANDKRIKLFQMPRNFGAGDSRNNSIKQARGRYIAFCDSDDCWMAEKLEKQIKFMQDNNYILTFSSYLVRNENNEITGIVKAPKSLTLSQLKKDNKIGCLTAIYDTKPYGKFYMSTLRKRQDWALFLNILKKGDKAYSISEPLAYYRVRNNSISQKKIELIKYNVKVYIEVFGYSKAKAYAYFYAFFMLTYIIKQIKNHIDSKLLLKSINK